MKSNKSFKACFIIMALSVTMAGTGCAQFGTYMKDRALDFADCFKADIGIVGVGAEAHVRITDAVVTGIGGGLAFKTGFKGRHFEGVFADAHMGLPFSPIYWFVHNEELHKDFPITYFGYTGNTAVFCGCVISTPGSYAAESIILYPAAFEKEPKFGGLLEEPKPIGAPGCGVGPEGKPFQIDLIDSFDVEVGGTLGFFLCLSAHVGFSPGQFVDFVLGWFGVDIGKDDYRSVGGKIENLVLNLNCESESVRLEAATALREMADERALPGLVKALKDQNVHVRCNAVRALGQIASKEATPALIDALEDDDREVRGTAIEALGEIGDARAIPHLIKLLDGKKVRIQLPKEALAKIGEPAVKPLIRALGKYDAAMEALREIGSPAVMPLIQALESGSSRIRKQSIFALRNIGDRKAVMPLIRRLQDEDMDVRRVAVNALGWLGDSRAVSPLIDCLEVRNEGLRKDVAWALSHLTKQDFGTEYAAWKAWYEKNKDK